MKPAAPRVRGVSFLERLLAALALLAAAPVLAVAGAGTRICEGGPVVYRARRAGLDGQSFMMFKFRTMRLSTPVAESGRITGGTDARVFPWGRILRRFKVDELPQLLNVVRGDMAIVGPRPEDPSIVVHEYASWMWETLSVPPGLTSPGSLDYYAEETTLPEDPAEAEEHYLRTLLPRKLAFDLVYVRHRSAAYDVLVVVRTIASVLGMQGLFSAVRMREWAEAERILREEVSR